MLDASPLLAHDAEFALLGAALIDAPTTLREIGPYPAARFGEPVHQRLWAFIIETGQQGRSAPLEVVASRFRDDTSFVEMGGARFLMDLIDKAPPPINARPYAEVVADCWVRREMQASAVRAIEAAADMTRPACDAIAALRSEAEQLEADAAPEPGTFITARASAIAMLAGKVAQLRAGVSPAALTGLNCIDRRIGGLFPGDLIIIGGRPSMGKTALARNLAYGAAVKNPDELFALFSIEMSDKQLSERAVSDIGADDLALSTERLRRTDVTVSQLERLMVHAEGLPENLVIDTRGSLSLDDVRRAVWALKRRGKLSAVCIDYLQIMRRPGRQGRNETSVIGEITAGLKQLARDANICVVLLSQLSRQVESREDKKPQMSDLRESGSIEQDADVVMFPFRWAYYLERLEPREGTAEHQAWQVDYYDCRRKMEVLIPKNRQGAGGVELQEYDAEFDRVQNWRG